MVSHQSADIISGALPFEIFTLIVQGAVFTFDKGFTLPEDLGRLSSVVPPVTRLSLRGKGLVGLIPESIRFLKSLTSIDLSGSNFSGGFENICHLQRLTELKVS